jgi:hypothetical protein
MLLAATCLLLLIPKDDNEEGEEGGLGVLRVKAADADGRTAAQSNKNLRKKNLKNFCLVRHNYQFLLVYKILSHSFFSMGTARKTGGADTNRGSDTEGCSRESQARGNAKRSRETPATDGSD